MVRTPKTVVAPLSMKMKTHGTATLVSSRTSRWPPRNRQLGPHKQSGDPTIEIPNTPSQVITHNHRNNLAPHAIGKRDNKKKGRGNGREKRDREVCGRGERE